MKFDAALSAMLARIAAHPDDSPLDVSVRVHAPLISEQVSELGAMGVEGADTRRTIFPARVPLDALPALAAKPWVQRVSLAQELRPLAPGERE